MGSLPEPQDGTEVVGVAIGDLEPDEIENTSADDASGADSEHRPRIGSVDPRRFGGEDDGQRVYAADDDGMRAFARQGLQHLRRQRAAHDRRLRPGTPRAGVVLTRRPGDSRNRRASGPRPVHVRGSRRSGGSRASPSGDDPPSDDDAEALARLIAAQAEAFSFSFDQFQAAVARHRSDASGPLKLAIFSALPGYLFSLQREALKARIEEIDRQLEAVAADEGLAVHEPPAAGSKQATLEAEQGALRDKLDAPRWRQAARGLVARKQKIEAERAEVAADNAEAIVDELAETARKVAADLAAAEQKVIRPLQERWREVAAAYRQYETARGVAAVGRLDAPEFPVSIGPITAPIPLVLQPDADPTIRTASPVPTA